jgi:hypothetical protein
MHNTQIFSALAPSLPLTLSSETAVLPQAGSVLLPAQAEIESEIAHVISKRLNPELAQWVEGYSRVGKRSMYLWKWCRQGVEVTTLSCVAPELYDYACDTKVLGVVLDVLLDDIADRKGDAALLEQLLSLPFDGASPRLSQVAAEDREYAEFTIEVWEEIKRRTRTLPLFNKFAKAWRYDYLQLFNAMRYSHMVNEEIALMNMAEHDLYSPHNMHIMVSATVDLMCSPEFHRNDWGPLREAVWNAQSMGRTGNLVTTWERELPDGDYTSGVYARAFAAGDVSLDLLLSRDFEAIGTAIRAGGHEDFFLGRWAEFRQRIIDLTPRVGSVDLSALLTGYRRLICLHLGSRGYK